MRILYRDEQVLAVDKPAGVLSVPGRSAREGLSASSIESLSASPVESASARAGVIEGSIWRDVQALAPDALPVHRLDRDTSGVLLFALGREAHRALSLSFEGRRAEKRYLALCSGDLTAPTVCELALVEGRKGGMRVAPAGGTKGALPSVTDLAPEERFAQVSPSSSVTLILARPRTGRTHQIRVHLAALGFPLLLDPRYGNKRPIVARELDPAAGDEPVLARTPLHAAALRVPHPSGKGWLTVESPLPADLSRCLALLRAARRR